MELNPFLYICTGVFMMKAHKFLHVLSILTAVQLLDYESPFNLPGCSLIVLRVSFILN